MDYRLLRLSEDGPPGLRIDAPPARESVHRTSHAPAVRRAAEAGAPSGGGIHHPGTREHHECSGLPAPAATALSHDLRAGVHAARGAIGSRPAVPGPGQWPGEARNRHAGWW